MQRIAPNNNLPATHFIEVWNQIGYNLVQKRTEDNCIDIEYIDKQLNYSPDYLDTYTVAVFRIRENKLPTLHNFNK